MESLASSASFSSLVRKCLFHSPNSKIFMVPVCCCCCCFFIKKKTQYLFIWLCWVLVAACGIFSFNIRDLVPPKKGSNLGPLHWELGVLATEPPGKSLIPVLSLQDWLLSACHIQCSLNRWYWSIFSLPVYRQSCNRTAYNTRLITAPLCLTIFSDSHTSPGRKLISWDALLMLLPHLLPSPWDLRLHSTPQQVATTHHSFFQVPVFTCNSFSPANCPLILYWSLTHHSGPAQRLLECGTCLDQTFILPAVCPPLPVFSQTTL